MKKKEQPFAFRWEWAIRDHAPERWTPAMMAVLYTLRTWMDNDTGHAWVSQEELAKGANVRKRQTVAAALKQTEEDGWLVRWRNTGQGQAWALSHYRAVIPAEVSVQMAEKGRPLRGHPSGEGSPISGQRMSDKGSKDVRPEVHKLCSLGNSGVSPGFSANPAPPKDISETEQAHLRAFGEKDFTPVQREREKKGTAQ